MTYVEMLKEEFLERKKRRPHYSERAFARDLKLSPSFMSLLFNGKRSLSPKTSLKIIKNIGWDEEKTDLFFNELRNEKFTPEAANSSEVKTSERELELDTFKLISNVRHFAILEFIQSRNGCGLLGIIEAINVDKIECEMVLARLLRLGMVQFENDIYKAADVNRKVAGVPSEAIRNYHRQAIELACNSIDEQDFNTRELRALTLCLDPNKLKSAKKFIDQFITEFNKKFGNKKNGEVYQLNAQLFSHQRKKSV